VVAAHVAEHEHRDQDQKTDTADGGIDEHAAVTLPRKLSEWVIGGLGERNE
jgi:hypothetical protein